MSSKFNEHGIGNEVLDNSKEKDVIKGKNALDKLHKDISKENEKNITLKISDIYGVDYDEAVEIHVNYHILRIKNIIEKNNTLAKMRDFIENHLDIKNLSSKVVAGDMAENTCIDMMISSINNQKETKIKDRYINFYG